MQTFYRVHWIRTMLIFLVLTGTISVTRVVSGQVCVTNCGLGAGVWRNREQAFVFRNTPKYVIGPHGIESQVQQLAKYSVLWEPGQNIKVLVMDNRNDSALISSLRSLLNEWEDCVNLRFELITNAPNPLPGGAPTNYEIRLSFNGPPGNYYSLLGTDSINFRKQHEHSMMLGSINGRSDPQEVRRVFLHEVGHAIGFQHEHQTPVNGIMWKQPAATEYYMKYTGWSEDQIKQQILGKLDAAQNVAIDFDPNSIMCYPIPAEITLNGQGVEWNRDLSSADRRFAYALYPDSDIPGLGLSVRVAKSSSGFGLTVVQAKDGLPAAKLRVQGMPGIWKLVPGDRIVKANGFVVRSPADLESAINGQSNPQFTLEVVGDDQKLYRMRGSKS